MEDFSLGFRRNEVKSSIWKLFLTVSILFIASAFYGYINGEKFYFLTQTLKRFYGMEILKINPFLLMTFIFSNNAFKSFIIIPLGVVLAIPPIIFIVFNGFIVGLIAYEVISKLGEKGLLYFAVAVLPHGVFELPAVFLSAALGVRVGLATIAKLRGGGDVGWVWIEGLKTYAYKVLPILFIAAVVEAFITPQIISFFFG